MSIIKVFQTSKRSTTYKIWNYISIRDGSYTDDMLPAYHMDSEGGRANIYVYYERYTCNQPHRIDIILMEPVRMFGEVRDSCFQHIFIDNV